MVVSIPADRTAFALSPLMAPDFAALMFPARLSQTALRAWIALKVKCALPAHAVRGTFAWNHALSVYAGPCLVVTLPRCILAAWVQPKVVFWNRNISCQPYSFGLLSFLVAFSLIISRSVCSII